MVLSPEHYFVSHVICRETLEVELHYNVMPARSSSCGAWELRQLFTTVSPLHQDSRSTCAASENKS
jgi:hypothetical protein